MSALILSIILTVLLSIFGVTIIYQYLTIKELKSKNENLENDISHLTKTEEEPKRVVKVETFSVEPSIFEFKTDISSMLDAGFTDEEIRMLVIKTFTQQLEELFIHNPDLYLVRCETDPMWNKRFAWVKIRIIPFK